MQRALLILIACQVTSAKSVAADETAFREMVAPIFQQRCLRCHNDNNRQGDLSLERGAAIEAADLVVPNDPSSSRLFEMITPQASNRPEMPKEAEPLTETEVAAIRNWIAAGAAWPVGFRLDPSKVTGNDWWSLQPITVPAVPKLNGAASKWIRTPIDAFVLRQMLEKQLTPVGETDRHTLIRRLYFDLIGLPPPLDEVAAFVQDENSTSYEQLVDKLLASPEYGERWARHWLDLVHYGDTHGYDKDKLRPNAWPYRDYVIQALNNDTPYGRFVKEQLAGDVLYPSEPQLIAATGFIAAGPWDYIGHVEVPATKKDGRIARNLDRDDMVINTMQTFCSVTAGCARCHDHKFDSITQEDYYGLQAVFAAIGRNDRPYDPDPTTGARRIALAASIEALESKKKRLTERIDQIVSDTISDSDRDLKSDLDNKIEAIRQQVSERQKDQGRSPSYGYHSQVAPDRDTTKWVQADLGGPQRIDQVVLVGADEYGWNDFGFPHRFKVEVSDDADFEDATVLANHTEDDFSRPGALPVEIAGKGIVARYVRVTGTRLWSRRQKGQPLSNDWIFAIGELAVLANERNVAESAVVTALDSIEAAPRWARTNLTDGVFGKSRGMFWKQGDLAELQAALADLQKQRDGIIMRLAPSDLTDQLGMVVTELQTAGEQIASLPPQQMVFAAATHFKPQAGHQPSLGKPLPIHVLNRGRIDDHLSLVEPGALPLPGGLGGQFDLAAEHSEGERRIALAHWIADERNPLTWRSIVNRMWQYHFGQGIVTTPNDFGRMGQQPTHPELLDWLAAEFRDGGLWIEKPQSVKALHRLIVTSSAYRQAAVNNESNVQIDSSNQYFWRFSRRRLEAEAIRDTVLLIAGKLNRTMYGPGFRDFVLEQTAHSPHFMYDKHDPDDAASHRRSIYRFLPRSQPQPFMQTLDCADPSQQVAKRDETVTALSALALLNNKFMIRMAEHFAARLQAESDDREEQIDIAFRLAFSRPAETEERTALTAYADEHGLPSACRVVMNLNEFVFVD